MERKLILILLSCILFTAASIALGIGYITLHRAEAVIQGNIADIEKMLENKFVSFDTLMHREEQPLDRAMRKQLPRLLADLAASGKPLADIDHRTLKSHAARYHFDEVYLINRKGVVVNTTFAPDLGLNLKKLNERMGRYIDNIYGKGRVYIDRVSASVRTGIYNKYAYFSPTGSDYILEVSVDLGKYIARATSTQYRDFLFGDFFAQDIHTMHNLADLDLFILLDDAQWSLLHKGEKMQPGMARRLAGRNHLTVRRGNLLVSYHKFRPKTPGTNYTYDVVSKVSCRTNQLAAYRREIIVLSVLFMLAAATLAFLFGSRFLKASLIKPLQAINDGIEEIGEGGQVVPLAPTGETELDHIVNSINAMQEKVVSRGKRLKELADTLEARVQRRTGQYRRARETAEAAVQSRDKFISLLSHDIKSPLANIRHVLGLLRRDDKTRKDERQAMTARCERSVTALLAFIDALFDLSRLQAGYTEIKPRFVHLRQLVEAQIGVCASLAQEKGVRILNEAADDVRIFADPALFGQVLHNLISNGVKFSRTGGTVRICASDAASISVSDDGVGIEEARLNNLFTPDTPVSTEGTAGERGTGMGLAYSYEIIRAHGGEMDVTSTQGEGAVFHLTLPVATQIAVIIDDEPAHRATLKRCLRRDADVAWLEFETAEQALEELETEEIAMMICDIQLPGMDGWAFLHRWRAERPQDYTPIVLVSSHIEGGDVRRMRQQAIDRGASDFIRKPFDEEDVIARTRRFLG